MELEIIRHSLAHILAYAVQELFPGTKFGIGPAIEQGFYYDFDFREVKIINPKSEILNPKSRFYRGSSMALLSGQITNYKLQNLKQEFKLTPEDLPRIEKKMRELIKKNLKFERKLVAKEEAGKIFKSQPYKIELIGELPEENVSIYQSGDFIDLCKGPHIKSTLQFRSGQAKEVIDAFKLTKIAGAYWKGSEKNPMLTRIYGVAFETKKELENYLKLQEEAKKRDHKKLGKELELFDFSEEIGAGLPLWLPKGAIIRDEMEKWAKEIEKKEGYLRVATPHITKSKLFYISGHLPHYAEDMYSPFKIDEEEYYLKPMNCPFHHMIFKSRTRSYRELPLRLAECATVYRYERSGVLDGLMRVRGFTQNDAHIYCELSQAKDEFLKVMKLHEFYYRKLGIKDYYMVLALRNPKKKEKYHGDDEMWQLAERLTREAMNESKIPYKEQVGEAAFYGPKIDFIIKTAVGKEYAISTNQLDLYMAKRFGLEYTDQKGKKQTPVIIHRAPLGTHERFIAFLLEHYAGAFPVWLAPLQAKIIPISTKKHIDYAKKLYKELDEIGVRVEFDETKETVSRKIRNAELQKIPYILVVGDKEMGNETARVRERGKGDTGEKKLKEFIERIINEIKMRI